MGNREDWRRRSSSRSTTSCSRFYRLLSSASSLLNASALSSASTLSTASALSSTSAFSSASALWPFCVQFTTQLTAQFDDYTLQVWARDNLVQSIASLDVSSNARNQMSHHNRYTATALLQCLSTGLDQALGDRLKQLSHTLRARLRDVRLPSGERLHHAAHCTERYKPKKA